MNDEDEEQANNEKKKAEAEQRMWKIKANLAK
jgi:hypothetical protein